MSYMNYLLVFILFLILCFLIFITWMLLFFARVLQAIVFTEARTGEVKANIKQIIETSKKPSAVLGIKSREQLALERSIKEYPEHVQKVLREEALSLEDKKKLSEDLQGLRKSKDES